MASSSIGVGVPSAMVMMVPRAKDTHKRSDSGVSAGASSTCSRVYSIALAHRRQGQGVKPEIAALKLQEQQFHPVAIIAHQRIARDKAQRIAGVAQAGTLRHRLPGRLHRMGDHQPQRHGLAPSAHRYRRGRCCRVPSGHRPCSPRSRRRYPRRETTCRHAPAGCGSAYHRVGRWSSGQAPLRGVKRLVSERAVGIYIIGVFHKGSIAGKGDITKDFPLLT